MTAAAITTTMSTISHGRTRLHVDRPDAEPCRLRPAATVVTVDTPDGPW